MRLRARFAMLILIGLVLITTGCTPVIAAIQTEFAARGATDAEYQHRHARHQAASEATATRRLHALRARLFGHDGFERGAAPDISYSG